MLGPQIDQNLKHLEHRLSVQIRNRGNEFQISGPEPRVEAAAALLHQLYRETHDKETIEPDFVHLYLQEAGVEALLREREQGAKNVMHAAKTPRQRPLPPPRIRRLSIDVVQTALHFVQDIEQIVDLNHLADPTPEINGGISPSTRSRNQQICGVTQSKS